MSILHELASLDAEYSEELRSTTIYELILTLTPVILLLGFR
jgi:hypothetical protein